MTGDDSVLLLHAVVDAKFCYLNINILYLFFLVMFYESLLTVFDFVIL